MGTRIRHNSQTSKDKSGKLVKTSPYLHTEKQHKKWFTENIMAKQRHKPKYDLKEKKQAKQSPPKHKA